MAWFKKKEVEAKREEKDVAWYEFKKSAEERERLAKTNAELLEQIELLRVDLAGTTDEVKEQLESKEKLREHVSKLMDIVETANRKIEELESTNQLALESWICEKQRAELAEKRLAEMTDYRNKWMECCRTIIKLSGQSGFKDYPLPKPKLDWE
jgi:uncharacterized coiled-coil DUF342 family protein